MKKELRLALLHEKSKKAQPGALEWGFT